MKKYLMHKDTIVACLDGNEFYIKDIDIYNYDLLPFIVTDNPRQFNKDFSDWRKSRCVPNIPQNFKNSKAFTQSLPYQEISHLVQASISDCYWLKPDTLSRLTWEDINYYKNKSRNTNPIQLSDQYFKKYYNIQSDLDEYFLYHPKEKKSIKSVVMDHNDNYCLIKNENLLNQSRDVYNELIGNILCDCFNLKHIDYYIYPYKISYHGKVLEIPMIACEMFNQTENYETLSIEACHRANIISKEELFGDMIQRGFEDYLNKMIVLDYLMLNKERDYTNISYIRDSNTLEIVDVMPIYDCGNSFYCHQNNYETDICMPFRKHHSEQIELVSDFSWLDLNELYETISQIEIILSYSPIDELKQKQIIELFIDRIHSLEQHIQLNHYSTSQDNNISEKRIIEKIKQRFDVIKIKNTLGFDPLKKCDINKIYYTFLSEKGKKEFEQFQIYNSNMKERFDLFKRDTFGCL